MLNTLKDCDKQVRAFRVVCGSISLPGRPRSDPQNSVAGTVKTVQITGQHMPITQKLTGESMELLVSERVDGALANDLEVMLLEIMRTEVKEIYVNLAEATFLCSAGIRVLLQYHRQMKNKGLKLVVTRPSEEVAAALEMTGFPELVE